MPEFKYLYPEHISPRTREVTKNVQTPLTDGTNEADSKDMYGNPLFKPGEGPDALSIAGSRDPNAWENPAGGSYLARPMFCEDCNKMVRAEELEIPAHLGHSLREGNGETSYDIEHVHKTGGDYGISWDTKPNEGSFAPQPIESMPREVSDKEAFENTVADSVLDKTVPM